MNTLTERSNLDHLRKQAKDLLRLYRDADATALNRLRDSLPAARGKPDEALIAMQLRLHDMQSCVAREHGCTSWNALKDEVALLRARAQDAQTLRRYWAGLVFSGDVTGSAVRPRPKLAARVLAEQPDLIGDDPWLACAIGDLEKVQNAIAAEPSWVNQAGGLARIPPLIAVTHSCLTKLPEFHTRLVTCLRFLLDRGADPNQCYLNRWPPHSLEKPGEDRLTALYGAAGKNHDAEMTRLLLEHGADGNDGESLYHSVEDPDPSLPCTRVLLEAGTRVVGSNALARVLDNDNLAGLELLLRYTPHGDPDLGRILHWAIYRGRSAAHIRALLAAGADPAALQSHQRDASHHAADYALPEVMRLLSSGGTDHTLTHEERFVAACARADHAEARRLFQPEVFSKLTPAQLKQLPNLAMAGREDAVRLMVELGWPIAIRGGDIDGSALNWAVFRGRPELTEFLLEHGASFRETHGYNSDVLGTLSWASINQPRNDGDWPGCAAALLRHGLPSATPLADSPQDYPHRKVRIDGRDAVFPEDVADILLAGQG